MGLEPSIAQGAWRCAEVALRLPLDQTYLYLIPGDWPEGYGALRPGQLVCVPWGKREEIGCVLRVFDHPPETAHSLRCLLRPASPWYSIDPPLIELARWIASYYLCPLGEALEAVSFLGFSDVAIREERWVRIAPQWANFGAPAAPATPAASGKETSSASPSPSSSPVSSSPSANSPSAKTIRWIERSKFRLALIDILDEAGGEMLASEALHLANANAGHLRALIEAGVVLERRAPAPWKPSAQSADNAPGGTPSARDSASSMPPGSPAAAPSDSPRALNPEQQFAFDCIAAALRERRFAAFLLQGVTGSGKTEVYLQAIQTCLEQGRQAICLVPEIALTPQTLERFQARFGSLAAVRHGGLGRPERARLVRAIQQGDVKIVIGARSAIFAPVRDLGLLVVDEEHETAYKQESPPRYHARDTGLMRARSAQAAVILGSATPSLESIANAQAGKYEMLLLNQRAEGLTPPSVEVLDMAAELRETRSPDLLSRRLHAALQKRLECGEQSILLLNRRGFANFALCGACGHIPRCPNDDVTLTYHQTPISFEDRKNQPASSSAQASLRSAAEEQPDLFDSLYLSGEAAGWNAEAGAEIPSEFQDKAPGETSRESPAEDEALRDAASGLASLANLPGLELVAWPGAQEGPADPLFGTDAGEAASLDKPGAASVEHIFNQLLSEFENPSARADRGCAKIESKKEDEREPKKGKKESGAKAMRRVAGRPVVPQSAEAVVKRLVCHFCGRKIPMPPRCPQCAAPALTVLGQGTQRIEEELKKMFPQARVLRMDSDTMGRRGAYDQAWKSITNGETDIILGTQMIAKGLHLERVTLVGVVLADVGLFTPDFRSAERTFSLLTQVAGRAGRGRLPGEVIIQSYVPQAEAIQCAIAQDVERFAQSELRRRRWLGFPPCARLASLTLSSRELERALECSSLLTGFLRRLRHRDACRGCTILGPMPAPIGRMRGRWRQRILIRAESPAALHALLRLALAEYAQHPKPSAVSTTVDIDPLDML